MPKITELWTSEGEQLIIDLWDKNYSGYQIAVALKTTRSAILGKISRMRRRGITFKRAYDPTRAKKNANTLPSTKLPPIKVNNQVLKMVKPEPPPKPVVVIEEPVPKYTGKPIPIMELTNSRCKYSVSGKQPKDFLFCGGPTYKRSYCKHHFEVCYVPKSAAIKPKPKEQTLMSILW
jgi:hypothetical protein